MHWKGDLNMAGPVVGAQLYTVRKYAATAAELEKTFKKLRGIGYRAVQLSGIGADITPAEIARFAETAEIAIAATHAEWERLKGDIDAVIAEHKMWNCRHTAIGGLPNGYRRAGGVDCFIEELKPIVTALTAEDIDFSYHNHSHEFIRYGDRTWLEELYEKASPDLLKAELDTYWIAAGGGNPETWIRKCSGRIPLLHLKDMCIVEGREQRFAEVGEGNLDWDGILAAAVEAGAEYFLVEQDDCYDRDPFESLAVSYGNLKAMGWE